jgi:hypothetical protein
LWSWWDSNPRQSERLTLSPTELPIFALQLGFVLRTRLELVRPQWSQDFLTTFAFTRTIFNITWSDVVVWTISLPYWNLARCKIIRFQLRYHLYSLYAIYQLLLIEFSEPSPKQIFLSARFLFVRVILLQGFLTWALFFIKVLRVYQFHHQSKIVVLREFINYKLFCS